MHVCMYCVDPPQDWRSGMDWPLDELVMRVLGNKFEQDRYQKFDRTLGQKFDQ